MATTCTTNDACTEPLFCDQSTGLCTSNGEAISDFLNDGFSGVVRLALIGAAVLITFLICASVLTCFFCKWCCFQYRRNINLVNDAPVKDYVPGAQAEQGQAAYVSGQPPPPPEYYAQGGAPNHLPQKNYGGSDFSAQPPPPPQENCGGSDHDAQPPPPPQKNYGGSDYNAQPPPPPQENYGGNN